jgi:hypothetical protein
MRKIHLMSMRLHNNAGIRFPLCYEHGRMSTGQLDMEKAHLPTVGNLARVTCAHCRRIARSNNSAYVNGSI